MLEYHDNITVLGEGVERGRCEGIKKKGGLYLVCGRKATCGAYCKSCHEAAENSASGFPPGGTIKHRHEAYAKKEIYCPPGGKKGMSYGTYCEKHNISMDDAEKLAQILNKVIPAHEKIVLKNPGRPRKKTTTEVIPFDAEFPKPKPRGRPKKQLASEINEDDLIQQLVRENNFMKKRQRKKPQHPHPHLIQTTRSYRVTIVKRKWTEVILTALNTISPNKDTVMRVLMNVQILLLHQNQ